MPLSGFTMKSNSIPGRITDTPLKVFLKLLIIFKKRHNKKKTISNFFTLNLINDDNNTIRRK